MYLYVIYFVFSVLVLLKSNGSGSLLHLQSLNMTTYFQHRCGLNGFSMFWILRIYTLFPNLFSSRLSIRTVHFSLLTFYQGLLVRLSIFKPITELWAN